MNDQPLTQQEAAGLAAFAQQLIAHTAAGSTALVRAVIGAALANHFALRDISADGRFARFVRDRGDDRLDQMIVQFTAGHLASARLVGHGHSFVAERDYPTSDFDSKPHPFDFIDKLIQSQDAPIERAMRVSRKPVAELAVGDLIDVPSGQLPDPPYKRARIVSIGAEPRENLIVVNCDDGSEQRFVNAGSVNVYRFETPQP